MSTYSLAEEKLNIGTHAFGIIGGIAALCYAVYTLATDMYSQASHFAMWVYGLCFIALYTCSTLYHSTFAKPKWRKIMRRFDHAAIYLMIAGSYTPFLWISLSGHSGLRWSVLIWGIAFIGIVFKLFFAGRFQWFSTVGYLVMGWAGVFMLPELLQIVPNTGLVWLVAGGLAYSLGTVFYMWKKLPFQHAIWHFFVLAGSALQWYAIHYYVLPGGLI